jgi:hypothetical protein
VTRHRTLTHQSPLGRWSVSVWQVVPRLRDIITSVWFGEGRAAYQRDRILPSGQSQLLINLGPAAWNFANFLGPRPSIALGLGAGASAGLLWVAGSMGINYLFERKSFKLFVINGGFHTLQFAIIGLVLSLMPCTHCASLPGPP